MRSQVAVLASVHLKGILRDRVLYAVFGVAAVLILMVLVMSSFSMRQVQELAITLSLSSISAVLLVVTLLLGSSSVWRDIERRYTTSILTLPVSRAGFLASKFISISFFIVLCTLVLGACSVLVIFLAASTYPSEIPIHWGNIAVVLIGDILKYLLLTSFALLLSTVSTSFYFPFFGSLAIYLGGSASQEVYEYVTSQFGQGMHPWSVWTVKAIYYLIPNFSSLDFHVQAVYGLPVSVSGFLLTVSYSLLYTGILLGMAFFAFRKRELP